MKQYWIILSAFFTLILSGCGSAKKSQKPESNPTTSPCNKTVRYIVEKFKMIESGAEEKMHTEIIFNPITKIISLTADDPLTGKRSFDTEIESFECNLNEKITSGTATYKGYVAQPDGRKQFATIAIETEGGHVYIKSADVNGKSDFYMIVDRWEIVNN